ncbi:MAG: hypothetical protein ACK41E_09115, partial [Deinococcales bacterium]
CPKVALVFSSRQRQRTLDCIVLEPLNQQRTTALLEQELGAHLPKQATTWIYQRVLGNPLFALEYLRYLARMGFLWNDGLRWHWREPPPLTMPTQIEALLEERLMSAGLAPNEAVLVYGTAYLHTRKVDLSALPLVTQQHIQDLQQSALTLQHLGLFNQDQALSHPLLEQVAFAQGKAMHQDFAQRAIEAFAEQPEQAVALLEDAALEPAQKAALWLASAARIQQPQLAAQHKINAAEFLSGTKKIALLLEVLEVIGPSAPQKTQQLAQSLLEYDNLEPEALCKATYALCFSLATTTRNLERISAALERLDTQEKQSERYLSNLLGYLMVCGQPQKALELWEQNPKLHTLPDFTLQLHVLSAWAGTGQFTRVLQHTTALLQNDLNERQRMNLYNIRALAFTQTGQLEAADQCQLEAIKIAKKTGQHNAIGTLLFNRAMTFERRNNRQIVQQYANEAVLELERAGNLAMAAQAKLLLANQDFESGDYNAALERLEQAYSSLKFEVLSPSLVTLELSLSRLHHERRLPYSRSLAQKFAREALLHAGSLQQPRLIAAAQTQLVLSAAQPNLESAKNALEVLIAYQDVFSVYAYAAYAHALESNQAGDAQSAWQDAVERAEALGFTFDAQLLKLELARLNKNQNQAKKLCDWFEKNNLLHGAHIARLYFPALSQEKTNANLEFIVLGTMRIADALVKGQKRKELLLLLLEARILGQGEVSGLTLLDRLYPNQAESEAQVALRQLIFKTRTAHGSSLIQTTQQGYALGNVQSDLEQFLQHPNLARWSVPYPPFGNPEVRDALHQAALQHAQTEYSPANEVILAMKLLLESDPFEREALRLLCLALQKQNKSSALQAIYATHRSRWLEVGETLPKTWQEFLG